MAAGPTGVAIARSPYALRRAVVALAVCALLWQVGARLDEWTGIGVPGVRALPSPVEVAMAAARVVTQPGYWISWALSFARVMGGFLIALVTAVPLGLLFATNRTFRALAFPVFEVIRPIPPLAWVPAAIIFWPTQEGAITFITFLGAFFTITINVFSGAQSIDPRFVEAAGSLGASRMTVFRRIVLPATAPSIVVASSIAIGLTWEVVVAAEIISGSSAMGSNSGGLGHFIWASYLGGAYDDIIVGMISIGIAGYLCSAAVRKAGALLTPWINAR
ncbi:ABC transporter permease [Hansschlegelia sp. KR7-227]|uniref:ABC transporter permease n=1 Tax=Hansschlegelia sp. KR7-227 TaxID=3400914 RepID=UPI003C0EF8C8